MVVDDTTIEKSGKKMAWLKKLFNSAKKYYYHGYELVGIVFGSFWRQKLFAGYNNSSRLIRDANNTLHLCFTSDDAIYHTYLTDTTWSEPEVHIPIVIALTGRTVLYGNFSLLNKVILLK